MSTVATAVPAPPRGRVPVATPWRWTAAAATAAAGVLHAVAAVQHVAEAPTLAAGFVLTALVQLATAGWLALGPRGSGWSTRVVLVAVGSTVAFLLVLLVAHTTTWLEVLHGAERAAHSTAHATGHTAVTGAVSLGLTAEADVEPLGLLGTATGLVEVLAVLGLVALLPTRVRSRTTTALLLLGLAAWAAWLTGLLG